MKPIFPHEIINVTVESHFSRYSKKTNLIYSVLLLFVVTSIVSLFLIKTEITIQSRGIFRSAVESVTVTTPVGAEVVKTNIYENKTVFKGDTLIWFNKKKLIERILYLENRIEENDSYIHDISDILSNKTHALKTNLYKSAHAQYQQNLAEHDLEISLQKRSFERAKVLYSKEVIPFTEYENTDFQLKKANEEKKIFVQQARSKWQHLAVDYEQENKNFLNEIVSLESDLNNYSILAPETGHIINFIGIQCGSFVAPGQTIAVISPDKQLLAENLVPPSDIGYLQKNMKVIFQVDAFNYNQWGLATGRIIDISNEIYIINNQPYFKVRSSLDQACLSLNNGYKGKLKKGLTNTARYVVTKRTLAQLFFDKTDN